MISETSKYQGQELFVSTIASINPCQDDVTIHKFASFIQEIDGSEEYHNMTLQELCSN